MRGLAARAVACKGWRWMAGMLAHLDGKQVRMIGSDPSASMLSYGVPDLTDPATLGCLQHLVIVAYHCLVVISKGNGWWAVETDNGFWDQDNTASFIEALVAALEAAP